MKSKNLLIVLLTVLLGLSSLFAGVIVKAEAASSNNVNCISPKEVELKAAMQKAWINHTIWTRSYIVSALSDLKDQQMVLERLLRNQQDIGNLIKPYYGEEAGNKLADLLKQHIVIAGKIVAAAKANNEAEVKKYNADWHKNADSIAKFLSEANPNWQFKAVQEMLYTHLELINEIVVSRLQADWKRDIEMTDKNEIHMIHLADILTEGIVKQFSEQF